MRCTYSIIYWSNTKIFLSIFSCFWKEFCFENFQKIQNFLQLYFGDSLVGHANRKAPVASLLRSSCNSLANESPSHEKHLEIVFQNLWVFSIFATHFSDLIASGSSSRELTQKVSRAYIDLGNPETKSIMIFFHFR